MKICWIHGFNSSHRSFTYLADQHPYDPVLVNYDSHQPLVKSIEEVRRQVPDGDVALVGHSLGGVIAVALGHQLAAEGRFPKIATISSPLGGSKAAVALQWLPSQIDVFKDITPTSDIIRRISKNKLHNQLLSIISTSGSLPLSLEPNDSVVTVRSQRALPYGRKVEVKATHFEVLLHDGVAKHLRTFI